MKKLDIPALKALVVDACFERMSLQALMDLVRAKTGLAMICFDTSFHLLAGAFERPHRFEAWERLATWGCIEPELVYSRNILRKQETIAATGSSILYDYDTCENNPQVCGPVFRNGNLIAYVGTMVDNFEVELVMQVNDLLCFAACILLPMSEEQLRGKLYEQLLIGEESSSEALEQSSRYLPAPYILAVLSTRVSSLPTIEYLRSALQKDFRVISAASANNTGGGSSMYLLFYGRDIQTESGRQAILQHLQEITRDYSFTGAISGVFKNLDELPLQKRRTISLIALFGNSTADSLLESNRYYGRLCARYAVMQVGKSMCANPLVEKLYQEDRLSGSDYIRTLYEFYRHQNRMNATAEFLNIHKNTLRYRMERIRQILEVDDLTEPGLAMELLWGILVLRESLQSGGDV